MVGIYKITNLINGKVYIGQSKNIKDRFKNHLYHHKNSPIGRDIYKYGKDNFSFEIIQECTENELDELEDFYIREYISNNQSLYNIKFGGQHNIGESNSNCNITEKEVYNIRESYKNGDDRHQVYELYKDKISESHFNNIWNGHSWSNIHMDIYDESKNISLNKRENCKVRRISNDDIYDIRERYAKHQPKNQVYELYKDKISESYFDKIWNGSNYRDIHYDVYTDYNRKYNREKTISITSSGSIFTDDQVLYYRRKHAYECIPITKLHKEFQEKYGVICLYNTFYDMIRGAYYKRIPLPALEFYK